MPFIVLRATGLVVLIVLSADPILGQDPKAADARAEIAALEKRVTKLEAELAAFRKGAAKETGPTVLVELIPVKGIEADVATKVLRLALGDRPRFKAVPLKEYGAIIVRGDEQTIKEAVDWVRKLQPLAAKP